MKVFLPIIILALALFPGCNRSHAELPQELVGTWTTDEPLYHQRSLKLEKEYVLVGFGEDVNPTVQRITKVDSFHADGGETTTIYSTDKEGPHQLTVYFDPTDGGTLVIKNARGRWRRQ